MASRYFTNKDSPTKRCPKCETWKPRSDFYSHKRNHSGLSAHCKSCVLLYLSQPKTKIRIKNWIENNRENTRKYHRDRSRIIRTLFLDMYGNRCSCCGEDEKVFLTIDHIKRQIGIKRKEGSNQAYYKALKIYDPQKYRILCHNCNQATIYGECPHQRKNNEEQSIGNY